MDSTLKYTEGCVRDSMPPCSCDCPLNLDIKGFLKKLAAKSFNGAYKDLLNTMLFPEITTRVCGEYCRANCRENMHILELERACIKYAGRKGFPNYSVPQKAKTIAIIGAGISGMACAQRLAAKKYKVTVYDRAEKPGGTLAALMDESVYLEEFALMFKYAPYTFVPDTELHSLDDLSEDAVYIATGFGGETFGLLDGRNERSLATTRLGVFLGGEVGGAENKLAALANGATAAISIEKYLMTGSMEGDKNSFINKKCLLPRGESVSPVGAPPENDVYTREEAVDEALRCSDCNCDICMRDCEFLKRYKYSPKILESRGNGCVNVPKGLFERKGAREIYSCSLCGHCKSVCPFGVAMDDMFLQNKQLLKDAGSFAPSLHDYFMRDLERAMGDDYLFRLPKGCESARYMFFPGCSIAQSAPEYALRGYEYMLGICNDTALLLGCCGVPALWAAEKSKLADVAERLSADWELAGRPVIVLMCLTCEKTLRSILPEVETISFYEFVCKNGLPEGATRMEGDFAVFDPCASRDFDDAQRAVRELATSLGARLTELPDSGKTSACCGMSGHIYASNKAVTLNTVRRAAALSDAPYIVYCANCANIFENAGKPCAHILDGLLGVPQRERAPHIAELRKNRAELKHMLLERIWGEKTLKEEKTGITAIIPEELAEKLDRRLIGSDEIEQVIEYCEKTGEKVYDAEKDLFTGHLQIGIITYWIDYAVRGDEYHVMNAYSHRITIEGVK